MKITTTAEAFVAALKNCKPDAKTPLPVLTTVKVDGNKLIATDLDLWTVVPFDGAVKGTGSFLIPWKQAVSLLSGEKGKLTIEYQEPKVKKDKPVPERTVKLTVNDCEYDLVTMNVTNFPQMPELADPTLTVDAKAFKKLLNRTTFAISPEQSRYVLNGAQLFAEEGNVTLVATDGHRLAIDSTVADGAFPKTIVPYYALDYLSKRLKDTVSIGEKGDYITFQTNGITVISRKLLGKFPEYEKVIPKNKERPITTKIPSCAKLASVVSRVAKCADTRSHAITLTANGTITLSAQSLETGKATATLPAEVKGGEVTIGLSADYLLDFLKAAGDTEVVLRLSKPDECAMFTIGEYKYIVMPMRLR